MDEHDLLATCWTSAGALRAGDRRGGARSPVPLAERIAAVVDAGYSGLGLDVDDLAQARQTIGFARLHRMLDDAGVVWIQVGTLQDWWTDGVRRDTSDAERVLLLEAAATLRASQVLVAADTTTPYTNPYAMTASWSHLARQAEGVGAQLVLESTPWSNLPSVEQASRFVAAAGHENGGILVDAMHAFRGGSTLASLRAGIVPDTLFAVELSDGSRAQAHGTSLVDESRDARLAPGAGAWDLVGFIRVMRELGFDEPWGVEVATAAHRALPVREALSRSAAATRAVLDASDAMGAPAAPPMPSSPAPVSAVDFELPYTPL
ncbi:sugar phosphate isomerase/epimerase family protein [Curtobacterium sp. RRHDQ10]|uniref:sugar phosphate isomerase/epimerase family protein n=1 Tax=Curtobacterium phyllosphaerae TaxID=3413379 RepID=UPI003BF2B0FB